MVGKAPNSDSGPREASGERADLSRLLNIKKPTPEQKGRIRRLLGENFIDPEVLTIEERDRISGLLAETKN